MKLACQSTGARTPCKWVFSPPAATAAQAAADLELDVMHTVPQIFAACAKIFVLGPSSINSFNPFNYLTLVAAPPLCAVAVQYLG